MGVGVDTNGANPWYNGVVHWVAVSDISVIQVFPTRKAVKSAQDTEAQVETQK